MKPFALLLTCCLVATLSEAQPTLGKRKKPGTPTSVSQAVSKVSTPLGKLSVPPGALSAPMKLRIKLPFSNTEKEYWVRKMGHNYFLNGDIIVGNDLPKTMTISVAPDQLWPNATIPVVIDPSIEADGITNIVLAAIGEFNQKTAICIIPRSTEKDYVRIVSTTLIPGDGASGIGRTGGLQDLYIRASKADKGLVMHELMHAAGFYHEQTRSNRNLFIKINTDNISMGNEGNFQEEEDGFPQGDYDYCSLMHYGPSTFANPGTVTIECLKDGVVVPCPACMGTQTGFTQTDLDGILKLYFPINRQPCRQVFPDPNRGAIFPAIAIPASDKAQESFRHRANYASQNGFAAGFPNFHEATQGINIVGGTILIKHGMTVWRDVPLSWLGSPPPPLNDFAGRMRATNQYAASLGFVGGFPNYHHANYGTGVVCGTFLLGRESAEWRDVPLNELGNPPTDDIRAMMTSANDYAFRNGFLGGFPTFFTANYGKGIVCGIVLIRKEAGEWRDVIIASGPR